MFTPGTCTRVHASGCANVFLCTCADENVGTARAMMGVEVTP